MPGRTRACSTPTWPTRPATRSTSGSGTGRWATRRSGGSADREPAVGEAGQLGADRGEPVEIEVGERHADGVGRLGEHGTPGVDDHAAAEAGAAGIVIADLAGGHDIALVLDRPGTQQHLPVVPSGVQHEGGRYDQQLRPAVYGEVPVQLGEAQVV